MLKKIIAVSAIFALFACSSDSDESTPTQSSSGGNSSSSQNAEVNNSSSSSSDTPSGPQIIEVMIATFNNLASELFKPYSPTSPGGGPFPYAFTLNEELADFWNTDDPECPTAAQTTAPAAKCRLLDIQATDAILQNTLTNQYSELHYDAPLRNAIGSGANARYAIQLKEYKLRKAGDQAALGLNVGDGNNEGKTIQELSVTELEGMNSFMYLRKGGAHRFRAVSVNNEDFWEYEVPATTDTATVTISLSELEGMGSFTEQAFDLSKISKFLWVVEYDSQNQTKNEGSLIVLRFRAQKIIEE